MPPLAPITATFAFREVEVEKLREAVERAPLANRTQRENDMFGLIE
jgi:hypothetical protein